MKKANYTIIQTVGNLSTDVKTFSNEGKKKFSKVNLIVNLSNEEKQYFTLKAFNELADTLAELQKGDLVSIKGILTIEKYMSKENVEKQSLVITLRTISKVIKEEPEQAE